MCKNFYITRNTKEKSIYKKIYNILFSNEVSISYENYYNMFKVRVHYTFKNWF